MAQRRAANIRERRRMFNLNEAFDKLRRKVSDSSTRLRYLQTHCVYLTKYNSRTRMKMTRYFPVLKQNLQILVHYENVCESVIR